MTPYASALPCQDTVFIRERCERIREDIIAAQQKVERIQTRIERSRRALSLWEARIAEINNANQTAR
jgi:hypothetical protein